MSWFPDQEAAAAWGGPNLRYPLETESFLEDIFWGQMPAWVSLDNNDRLVAFGQYYMRGTRCNLARLALSPHQRGGGEGARFIEKLMQEGQRAFDASGFSLFVMSDNLPAYHCYRKLGFQEQNWPGDQPLLEHCLFMTRGKL